MLKLTYTRASDPFAVVTVLSDPVGIRDLYYQLTRNYKAEDGTKIGSIIVSNLDGYVLSTAEIFATPNSNATYLSKNLD